MTLDDDFIQITLPTGMPLQAKCKALGIEWPPPEILDLGLSQKFKRLRYSQLPDDVAAHPNLARGAEYKPIP